MKYIGNKKITVDYRIAVKLKEKGFEQIRGEHNSYLIKEKEFANDIGYKGDLIYFYIDDETCVTAPTIYEVMEWMSMKDIYFVCHKDSHGSWRFDVYNYNINNKEPRLVHNVINYDSKMVAYNTCIEYILDYML